MNKAKTPAEIAKMFGCTVDQARVQIKKNAEALRSSAMKAAASKSGKLRGLTAEWYCERATAFKAVL